MSEFLLSLDLFFPLPLDQLAGRKDHHVYMNYNMPRLLCIMTPYVGLHTCNMYVAVCEMRISEMHIYLNMSS